eukprot:gene12769-14080_t
MAATLRGNREFGAWTSSKELLRIVELVIGHNKVEYLSDLETTLTHQRPSIISLLENPEKNSKHRKELKKAPKEGIQLQGESNPTKLPESFVQEVLLFSDALGCNELSCVDLLLSAEQQISNFPGFSLGSVAALLYQDGRRCLLSAIKLLLTGREGLSWALELDDRTIELVNKYTSQLFDDGLLVKLLRKLCDVNVQSELDKLEKCKAVGSAKHKKQLIELITEQRNLLSDCLFCWACQSPLGKKECSELMDFLKDCTPSTSDGTFDYVTLKIVMSLLISWETSKYEALAAEPEALENAALPVFSDVDFITNLHQAIIRPDTHGWRIPGIKSVLQFAWAVLLRVLSQFQKLDSCEEIFEEDEELLNVSIENDAIKCLKNCIIPAASFHQEEYFVKTIHTLITTLIVKYPLKTKDLRNRGDENARIIQVHLQEGIEPPKELRHDFKDLLLLIGDVYASDSLGLELSNDYWCPTEPLGSLFSPRPVNAFNQSIVQKQVMLNKFVRLAGDLMPQAMFTAYVKMLTGLSSNQQSAQHCFNLLNSNGSMGRASTCAASWDHFFYSFKQYYASMKQDVTSTDHPSHMHHHHSISPEELTALESVLGLIKTVAEHSESVRIALCENQSWLPIASFFGLIGCPVPCTLKAALLEALAAFAKSPEISTALWQSLEATQILRTVKQPQGVVAQEAGIKMELDEIEARNEVYPQTRAFLRLLSKLTDITLPSALGAGYRVPGFAPYLDFIKDDVFLKFKGRAYQDVSEKWSIAGDVLEIFVKILSAYEPSPEHLSDQNVEIQGVNFGRAAKPPGYEILLHLLNDTPMFRLVMNIIDTVYKELEESTAVNRKDQERCVLYCIRLIECALEKQTTFVSLLRDQNSSIVVTPMEQLLLSINPSTAEADYPYKIARYIVMNNVMLELVLSVVRILRMICAAPTMQTEIVGILASKKLEREEMLVGFCEHLDNDIPEEATSNEDETDVEDDAGKSEGSLRNSIRQNIVSLLLSTLHQPSPNLAQLLLGFDINRSISRTIIQDAGVGRFPKNCFHSIIGLLNRDVDCPRGPACIAETPKLAELMYQLVYFLCAHPETGAPSQRYLRANHDFFVSHGSRLPFTARGDFESTNSEMFITLSNQQSWLLKTIAIEIKLASKTRLRSSMVRILAVLFGQQTSEFGAERFGLVTRSQAALSTATAYHDNEASRNLVSIILSDLQLTQDYPTPLTSNMFDIAAIEHLISSCEEISEDTGVILCDVKMLHRVIMTELNSTQGMAAMGQRPEILKEVKNILQHAVERNLIRQALSAKRQALEAWRQVVETTFAVCQYDVFSADLREVIILDLLQEALSKASVDSAIPELFSPIAGAILMLMTQYHASVLQRDSSRNPGLPTRMVDMAPLLTIFQGIVTCLSSASHWKTRCNLYGASLYYMQIGRHQSSISDSHVSDDNIFGRNVRESWEANTLSFLAQIGETFMDMVCKDACEGPEIGKMLSFAVLDSLISIDWQGTWTSYLSSHGYLRHLVDSIASDDVALQAVFASDADAMKTIYTFESKMSFLTRFSQTELGAQILLHSNLTARLAECQFLDHRPEELSNIGMQLSKMAYSMQYEPLSPNKAGQYRTVFMAVGKLIRALVSTFGPKHKDFLLQIQDIVMAHEETFLGIIQDKSILRTLAGLQELALTTSILSLLQIRDSETLESITDDSKRARAFLARLQRKMLGLMQTFASKDYCKRILKDCLEKEDLNDELSGHFSSGNELLSANITRVLLQIRSNLFSYAKSLVSSSGLSGACCHVLFSPSLLAVSTSQPLPRDLGVNKDQRALSMCILVEELEHASGDLLSTVNTRNKLCRKLENINDISAEETSQLLAQEPSQDADRLTTQQRKIIAQKVIQKLIDLSDDQACLNIQIIENILYILWRHIEYYFIHCNPVEGDEFELDLPKAPSLRARRLQDISIQLNSSSLSNRSRENQFLNIGKYSVTKAEVRQLTVEAKSVLTDKLMKKMIETEQVYGKNLSRVGFISAMVRRIQGLDGRIDVVSNETGERVTATSVGYTGAEKIIGFPAKQLAVRCPQSVINFIKFLIGTSHLEESYLKNIQDRCHCEVFIQNDCPNFKVSFDDTVVTVTPSEAALFVLTKLLENAETVGGADLEDTVLTVPIWFTEKQRIELSEACEDAGFNVLRFVSEPAAALLAYGIGQENPSLNSLVLVYRIGGTSMDATLVEVNCGMYRVISSNFNQNLGGETYDEVLVDIFIDEFKRKWKMNVRESKRSLRKLRTAAEQCKITLSSNNVSTCSVDSLFEGIDFTCQITRAKFESCCLEVFNKCQRIATDLVSSAGLNNADINKIILVGGSTRIPKISQMISDMFPEAEVLSNLKPEEVLAIGAAQEAAILQGKEEIDFADLTCPLECTSSEIVLEISENGVSCRSTILKQFSPVPTKRSHSYTVKECQDQQLIMNVYEVVGKEKKEMEDRLIAKFSLNDVKSGDTILSTFEMTRECTLRIAVTDKEQSRTESLTIELESL